MNFLIQKPNPLTIAQYLVIGGLVSITISPPLANIFIALSLIATLSFSTIRNQLIDFFKTKLGYACIAFIAVLFSGLLYGIESNSTITSSIWGWRKFLMLPIAAAIFVNAPHAKQNLINSFWFICLILAIYSFSILINPAMQLSEKHSAGIVVRNYATQGIFFSAAAIIAFANTLNQKFPKWIRTLSGLTVPLFILNITHVSIGRSGYVALIVMSVSFIFLNFSKVSILKRIVVCLITIAAITGTLVSTKTSQLRIELAKSEFQSGIMVAEETSIGARISFWKNTIEMVPKYIFLGTGAGGFEKAYSIQVQEKIGAEGLVTADPHNQYLKLLVELGLGGVIIFLLIIFLLLKQKSSDPFRPIGLATLFAICATSFANSHFSTFNEGQFIWIITGSLLASETFSIQRKTS